MGKIIEEGFVKEKCVGIIKYFWNLKLIIFI